MRFLHISDLHIGKRLKDVSLIEDQKIILKQIVDIAVDKKVDCVLVAGDAYQRATPHAEAVEVWGQFVTDISEAGIKLAVVRGNHDSEERISLYSKLLSKGDVYVTEKFDGSLQKIALADENGEINVWMLPYVKPRNVKKFHENAEISSYTDAIKTVIDSADIDTSKRNVLMCHQYINGGETSDSEEMQIGGLDAVDGNILEGFDYVALGHLHRPQKVIRDTMRYAGSPMKYSFSEVRDNKGVLIVDMGEKGKINIEKIPLNPPHDMRDVDGTLDEILKMPYSEDYVRIITRDEDPAPDAALKVTTVFPNRLQVIIRNSKTKETVDVIEGENADNKTILDLFCEFYKFSNNSEPGEEHLDIMKEILEKAEDCRYEAD